MTAILHNSPKTQNIVLFCVGSVFAHGVLLFLLTSNTHHSTNTVFTSHLPELQISLIAQRSAHRSAHPKQQPVDQFETKAQDAKQNNAKPLPKPASTVTGKSNAGATEPQVQSINTTAKPFHYSLSIAQLIDANTRLQPELVNKLSLVTSSTPNKTLPRAPKVASNDQQVNHQAVQHALSIAISNYFKYPRIAQRNGWQGMVELGLRVEASGQLSNVHIIKTSGYSILDDAAIATLNNIQRIEGTGNWLNGHYFDTVLPIQYNLIDG